MSSGCGRRSASTGACATGPTCSSRCGRTASGTSARGPATSRTGTQRRGSSPTRTRRRDTPRSSSSRHSSGSTESRSTRTAGRAAPASSKRSKERSTRSSTATWCTASVPRMGGALRRTRRTPAGSVASSVTRRERGVDVTTYTEYWRRADSGMSAAGRSNRPYGPVGDRPLHTPRHGLRSGRISCGPHRRRRRSGRIEIRPLQRRGNEPGGLHARGAAQTQTISSSSSPRQARLCGSPRGMKQTSPAPISNTLPATSCSRPRSPCRPPPRSGGSGARSRRRARMSPSRTRPEWRPPCRPR